MITLTSRNILLLDGAAGLFMLGAAMVAQYGFDLHPCHLCLLQRYPYAAVAAIGLGAAFARSPRPQFFAALVCGLLLLGDAGLAFYHAGVEWGVFPGPSGCVNQQFGEQTLEQMRAALIDAPLVSCDQAMAHIFGLSLAAWNGVAATLLTAFTFFALAVQQKKIMTAARRLPGDLPPEDEAARMIRVNHAGEYGAQRIYAGQLAVLGKSACGPLLRHMADQEQAHLDAFSDMMKKRRVRPTALMPLWHVAGYALGALTAMMGEKAAMACTVAVESVIDEHYARQEARLPEQESELKSAVTKFRADEKEHHDAALAHGAQAAPLYPILTAAISYQTRLAIWLSTRV